MRQHDPGEVVARHPGHRHVAFLAPPHHRAQDPRAHPLDGRPRVETAPAPERRGGQRRPNHRGKLVGRLRRGGGRLHEGRFQARRHAGVAEPGPDRVEHVGGDRPVVAIDDRLAGSGSSAPAIAGSGAWTLSQLRKRPFVRLQSAQQRPSHRVPDIAFMVPPDLAERIVKNAGDLFEDRSVGGARLHSVPSAASPSAAGAPQGSQSRSGISPAARKPSRARSVMSLWKKGS